MIELRALNLHWLESFEEPEYDLCAHSPVFLRINEFVVSDENSGDWTVSASAYGFLRSLGKEHKALENCQLLPCCAFQVWQYEDKLIFNNCGNGINWDIARRDDKIVHTFGRNREFVVDYDQWKQSVFKFSGDVLRFYETSAPKKFSDEEDKMGFHLLISEIKRMRDKAFQ